VIRFAKTVLVLLALVQQPVAVFEGKNTLVRPEGYREWVFVGSSLGLSYAEDPAQARTPQTYHNVYMIPWAFREFSKTGKFPEGTMMVLELATAENKSEPGLQGSYEKDYTALEVSLKDSTRFDGGWGYFNFTERPGVLKAKADPFPKNNCWACHDQKAATDHVFTQFYPVLRAARPN
jgi:cytochrome P460